MKKRIILNRLLVGSLIVSTIFTSCMQKTKMKAKAQRRGSPNKPGIK